MLRYGGRCWWKANGGCGVGKKSAYIFLSENHERAFEQALVMGRRHENIRKEGRRLVSTKLAEIVSPGLLRSESV